MISLLELYDRARPEDWIAQLVEVNRELSDELRRLQELSAARKPRGPPDRLAADIAMG